MADIFLSYAHSDAERAKRVVDALEARGWHVWWDRGIAAGELFRDTLVEELQSARCVVVLWSATSVKSNYVLDEAERAQRRGVLVQAVIEDVSPPLGFGPIQYATLVDWSSGATDGFEQLCRGIIRFAALSDSRDSAQPETGPSPTGVPPAAAFPKGAAATVPPDLSVGDIAQKWVSLQLEFLAIPNRGLTAQRPFMGGARGFWLVEGPPAARDAFKEVASRAGELLTTKPEWLRAHKVTFSEFLARGGLQMWVLFLGLEKPFTTTLDNLPQRSAEACAKCATEAQKH